MSIFQPTIHPDHSQAPGSVDDAPAPPDGPVQHAPNPWAHGLPHPRPADAPPRDNGTGDLPDGEVQHALNPWPKGGRFKPLTQASYDARMARLAAADRKRALTAGRREVVEDFQIGLIDRDQARQRIEDLELVAREEGVGDVFRPNSFVEMVYPDVERKEDPPPRPEPEPETSPAPAAPLDAG